MASGTDSPAVAPYGPFGLVLSLVCILVLATVYAALFFGVLALADAALFGWTQMLATAEALRAGEIERPSTLLLAYALSIVLYLAVAAAILSLARFRGGAGWHGLVAWRAAPHWWRDRRYWLLVAAAIVYGTSASAALSKFYPPSRTWFTLAPGAPAVLITFFLVVCAAPVTEEMLFRGWIYTSLRSRLGNWASVTISALLFAFAHYEHTHLYALAVFPIGLILGAVRERTGTFWATAGLHALYNFSAWLLEVLGVG